VSGGEGDGKREGGMKCKSVSPPPLRNLWETSSRPALAGVPAEVRHVGLFTCIHEAAAAVKAFRAEHGFTESHGEAST